MADTALDIVREFACASETAVRRKGMRALGALPSNEAGALLVDTALDDSDPETGRLRLLGGRIELAHPSWPLRLRRALGLWNEQRRGRGWRYWLRGVARARAGHRQPKVGAAAAGVPCLE